MHIIVDATPTQLKPYSGIGEYTRNLIRELIVGNHEEKITLLLFDQESPFDTIVEKRDNVSIEYIGAKPGKIALGLLYWLRLQPAINKVIKQDPDDQFIFFSTLYQNGFPVNGIRTILAVHDFAMPEFNYYSDRGRIMNLIRKMEYWYHMDRSEMIDAIITPSENTAFDYMRYYPNYDPDKVFTVMLGVDIEESETDIANYLPADWEARGYFIYLGGGIQSNKNSEGVVLAYNQFLQKFQQDSGSGIDQAPYLLIAGKIFLNEAFPGAKKLKDLIRSLGLEKKVVFTGYYEDSDKYSLLKNSIAFIHLSLFEGFGIAVAEAMRCGKPVVVHSGTSYPEVVGDAGYLVDGTDPESVGKVLFELFSDPDQANKLGMEARERSYLFTWEKCASETMEIFRKIVEEEEGIEDE